MCAHLPLNNGIPRPPLPPKKSGGCIGCYVFKYLRIWRQVYASGLFHATFFIYRTTPSHLAPSSTTGTLFKVVFFFLITRTLKQDDLAAAFSTTSLTELEQNHSSGRKQPEFVCGFKVFLFCLSILSVDKTPKKVDKYLGNREAAI